MSVEDEAQVVAIVDAVINGVAAKDANLANLLEFENLVLNVFNLEAALEDFEIGYDEYWAQVVNAAQMYVGVRSLIQGVADVLSDRPLNRTTGIIANYRALIARIETILGDDAYLLEALSSNDVVQ